MSDKYNIKEGQTITLNAGDLAGGVSYWVTPNLRFAKYELLPHGQTQLRLQQMWQGSDGSEKWEWVPTYEEGDENEKAP